AVSRADGTPRRRGAAGRTGPPRIPSLPRPGAVSPPARPRVMTSLVIDTDPGVDDAQAIMLAFAHPAVTVHALTVVAGNVGLDRTVANACTILDALDAAPGAPPVFPGCAGPLLGSRVTASSHGSDGRGDGAFPASTRPVEAEHAALALTRLGRVSPGALTLVTI